MKNQGLAFNLPVRMPPDECDVPAILLSIQKHVFQRRLRVKDAFRDFDNLRCGRCTREQFMRGANTTMASLKRDELEALADYYTEEGLHVQRPRVVGYKRFVAELEEVFTVARLERQPTRKVPRAGSSLQTTFLPRTVGVENEEERVQAILQKIALLCHTRGIIFLSCFQDCDRSDSVSLVTPRYSGKATLSQFRQHFPLIGDLDDSELRLLAKRYTTSSGDINYQAMDRDIQLADSEVPPPSAEYAPSNRVPQSPRSPVADKRISCERSRREAVLQETRQSIDIMDKLRAMVAERRLRLMDCFIDFDKLRKGQCTMSHVRTVFTVLGIELECREYKSLEDLFCNEEGLFCYRNFCSEVCEINQLNINSWDMELPPTPSTAREERPGSRLRYKARMHAGQQQRLAELEGWVRTRAETRSLDLKRCFQDFDKVCVGHVTRTQFHRIMNMLNCDLSNEDAEILCMAYCDTNNGQEFNYIDFCDSLLKLRVEKNEPSTVFQISRRPKYFDRTGETIFPLLPLDTTGLSSKLFQDSDNGGGIWTRAWSR